MLVPPTTGTLVQAVFTINGVCVSRYVRKCRIVLDSGFYAVDSGSQLAFSSLCQGNFGFWNFFYLICSKINSREKLKQREKKNSLFVLVHHWCFGSGRFSLNGVCVSRYVRKCRIVLDSGFYAVDSGSQLAFSSLCQGNFGFWNPRNRWWDSEFHKEKFVGFQNLDTLTWVDVRLPSRLRH